MPKIKTTGRLRRHSYGRDAAYKGHRDPAADAKTCYACGAYKPLTSFRRIVPRGYDPDDYAAVCKTCSAAAAPLAPIVPREEPEPNEHQFPLLPAPEAIAALSDAQCDELFLALRWPDGVRCPKCEGTKLYALGGERYRWRCAAVECKAEFTPTSKSPFANHKVPLRTIITILALAQRNKGEFVVRRTAADLGMEYKSAYTLLGKAIEFLSIGVNRASLFRGYFRATGFPQPRATLATFSQPIECTECGERKATADFAKKCGAAGAWGLRVSVCKDCVSKRSSVGISAAWDRRKEEMGNFPPLGSDIAQKTGNAERAGSTNAGRASVTLRSVADLLSAGPRYQFDGDAKWWSTRMNWTPQEHQDLSVLCENATQVERAADVLGRSPTSLAWHARDMGLTLPREWSRLIAPKRILNPKIALCYPYIVRAKPSDSDLLRVNDLVPHAFPEWMRADICQAAMLALYEGTTTLAELENNRNNLTYFIKRYRKEQQPWQEVSLSSDDDGRSPDEIAASINADGHADGLNNLRRAAETFTDHYEPTQIDDVYEREVNAAHFTLANQRKHLNRSEVKEMLSDGVMKVKDSSNYLFGAWDRVRGHARKRLQERYGISLDRRRAEAIVEFCRSREPEWRTLALKRTFLFRAN